MSIARRAKQSHPVEYSSAQLIHQITEDLYGRNPSSLQPATSAATKQRSKISFLGLKALIAAADEGTQPEGVATLVQVYRDAAAAKRENNLIGECAGVREDNAVVATPTAATSQHRALRVPGPMQTVAAAQVVDTIFKAVQGQYPPAPYSQQKTKSNQSKVDDVHPTTPPRPRHHRDDAIPDDDDPDEDAMVQSRLSRRRRELQKLMWEKISYGTGGNTSAPSPKGTSPKKSPLRSTRSLSPSPTKSDALVAVAGPALLRQQSSLSTHDFPMNNNNSFLSSTGLSGNKKGEHIVDEMPSSEDISEAFAAAQKTFRAVPLRSTVRESSIEEDEKESASHQLCVSGGGAQRSVTLAEEMTDLLWNCSLMARCAYDVSPCDAQLKKTFAKVALYAKPPITAPPRSEAVSEGDDFHIEPSDDEEFEIEPSLQLRKFGCDGDLQWAISSFSVLPRSIVTVSVATDPSANGFVEFPGTGRAGTAPSSVVVIGSQIEMLQHEMISTMLLEGMLGLESVGRAAIEFNGPQVLERSYFMFSEGVSRSLIAAEWQRSLVHSILSVRSAIKAAVKRKSVALMGTGDLRGDKSTRSEYSVWFTSIVQRCEHILAEERAQTLAHALRSRYYKKWLDASQRRNSQFDLTQSILQMSRQEKVAHELLQRHTLRTQADAFRAFRSACFRKKKERHLQAILRIEEDERQKSHDGRAEVVVADVALSAAKRLVTALRFAFASIGHVDPITLTGHSSGGAVALLAACLINAEPTTPFRVRRVVTFGSPKVFRSSQTELLKKLDIMQIAVQSSGDPGPQQPLTYDPTGLGCFVIDKYAQRQQHTTLLHPHHHHAASHAQHRSSNTGAQQKDMQKPHIAEPLVVQPVVWSEAPQTISAARSHWIAFHAMESYVAACAPAAFSALRRHTHGPSTHHHPPSGVASEEELLFEERCFLKQPVRGAGHGFSPVIMKCIQHIATRYGVGAQQRIPRDLVLGLCALMPNAPLHLINQRLPIGQGGRIDQVSFVGWLWSEAVLDPQFLSAFLKQLKYEFNGIEFLPTQKLLVQPPPCPKILAPVPLYQPEEGTLTTIGRSCVEHIFSTHARMIPLSPLEFRLPPNTLLISHHCITQMLENGNWSHRCAPAEAVHHVYHQVAQAHLNMMSGLTNKKGSVFDRLSRGGRPPSDARRAGSGSTSSPLGTAPSPSASKVRRSLQEHQRAPSRTSSSSVPSSQRIGTSSSASFNPLDPSQILLTYCGELTERGFQHFFQLFVKSFGVPSVQQALWLLGYNHAWAPIVTKTVTLTDIHWKFGPCLCLKADAERKRSYQEEEVTFKSLVSEIALDVMKRRKEWELNNTTLSWGVLVPPGRSVSPDGADALFPQRPASVTFSPSGTLTVMPPGLREIPQSDDKVHAMPPQHSAGGAYRVAMPLKEWAAKGNGAKLQRDTRREIRDLIRRQTVETSVGAKPRRRIPDSQKERTKATMTGPSLNALPTLSAMYGPANVIRLINADQRRVLHLPPLKNQLLEGSSDFVEDDDP